MENEIWKDIPGYGGSYQASNLGRVRSTAGKIISQRPDSDDRYMIIDLYAPGKTKTKLVHRLIAAAFHGSIEGLEINHKLGNMKDNRATEIEIVTHSQNELHKYQVLKVPPPGLGRLGKANGKAIKIFQLHKDTREVISTFYGAMEVQRRLGYDQSTIHKCCKGVLGTFHGFKWIYGY